MACPGEGDEGAYDPSCPFCQIVKGDETALMVYQWPDFLAFTPQRPATEGHTLIAPAAHVPTIWELSAETAQGLSDCVTKIANAMRDSLALDGLNIIQSNGAAATQSIDHLHVHLVPRYRNDAMGQIWPEGSPVSVDRATVATSALKAALE